MPITLTTPKATGDLDPNAAGNQYTQVKITKQTIDLTRKLLTVTVSYGNTVNGHWVPGILPAMSFAAIDQPANGDQPAVTDFTDLVGTAPAAPVEGTPTPSLYDQVSKRLYQWLLAKQFFPGTIV